MTSKASSQTFQSTKLNWLYYLLILLTVEKIIQHIVVTLAFYFNWGIVSKRPWVINLVIFLALFDIVGEFVAQGKIGITITVSFMVALFLLIISLLYRRQPG